MWQVTTLFLLRVAQGLIQAGGGPRGALNGVWAGLFQQGTPPPTPQMTMAQIVEASYDGYSRQAVVWFPPWISNAGPEQLAAQDVFFVPSDALVANLITGVFIADAFYGGNLLMAALLPVPGVNLGSPSQALKDETIFQLPFNQIYGGPKIVT